ncbi:histidine phosphatase superfamily [Xylariomycetidae sp. FL0641]|nr:histidine phosphatase superfamily [Xylariomycetidae sp. FL0641]
MSTVAPIVHIVRHAQGEHNAQNNEDIWDPHLTDTGKKQCEDFAKNFGSMDNIRYLVASPMHRTIDTCLRCCPPAAEKGCRVFLVPDLIENGCRPCDTGRPREDVEKDFEGQVFSNLLVPNWEQKHEKTDLYPTAEKVEARARRARHTLRLLLRGEGKDLFDRDPHLVVVSHGCFIPFLTEDFEGVLPDKGAVWTNTECRSYRFVNMEGPVTDNATLRETTESLQRRGKNKPAEKKDQDTGKRNALVRLETHRVDAEAYFEELRAEASGGG